MERETVLVRRCLSLTDALACMASYALLISHVKNVDILFTPAKIYTRENLYLQKLSIDAVPPKHENLTPRKFVPLL